MQSIEDTFFVSAFLCAMEYPTMLQRMYKNEHEQLMNSDLENKEVRSDDQKSVTIFHGGHGFRRCDSRARR